MRGEISLIFGGRKVELRQMVKAVTPFGGLVVFLESLRKVGFAERVKGVRLDTRKWSAKLEVRTAVLMSEAELGRMYL